MRKERKMIMKHLKKDWPERVSEVLLPHHLDDLYRSELSDEIILQNRIYSAISSEAMNILNRKKEIGPGCVFPYPLKRGFSDLVNFKPDEPIYDKDGKLRKYIKPIGSNQCFYIPKPVWLKLRFKTTPLIFTEGEKKALKATQEGHYAIALSGVWGWKSKGEPIRDFDRINFKDRTVYIVFDADKHTNINVYRAEQHLAEYLTYLGANVLIADLGNSKK